MATPKGLSFVFIEPGSHISEADHYDWYDNEHSPARLTVPGFLTARRYKAVDSQQPTYLTLYDLTKPSVANGPACHAFHAKGSNRDKEMLSSVQFLNRRTYELIDEPYLHPDTTDASVPGKYLALVGIDIKAEAGEDFNRWYREEHIPKVPGWIRGRRYKLYDNLQRGALNDGKGLHCAGILLYMSSPADPLSLWRTRTERRPWKRRGQRG
ncbi:hypothetical protein V5O48_002545 [Marasmius crinis-equi]|uniref:Uncharacterized protein n=1 Tax=Marasmius crinis-equi TaxID=585013 RepID=A0ABR3FV97_9AGAR